jgi:SAM-dependent methyltransferase
MTMSDTFQGSPWNAKPTEEWNGTAFWHCFYSQLLSAADDWERGQVVYRDLDFLLAMLRRAGELPLSPSRPRTLLDAGCGIALIPHVLAFWGFRVTAIDSSQQAIEVASGHRPTEEELARCISIWDPFDDMPNALALVESPERSLQRLRAFQAPGGSVSYLVGDWFAGDLSPESFGVVYCRNSLRCSTKSYWRRSLSRFHELLSPGGVLLLENINAIGIRAEVEELYAECGFVRLGDTGREPAARYVLGMWPTG